MAETTEVKGELLIGYESDEIEEGTERWGFAQYVNKGGLRIFFGEQNINGLSSLQCWEGKNPGCEVGIDTSKYKKFTSLDPSKLVVTIDGVEYTNTNTGRKTTGYDAGLGDQNNLPIKITFLDRNLLEYMKNNRGNKMIVSIRME